MGKRGFKYNNIEYFFLILFIIGCAFTTSGYALSSVEGNFFHLFLVVPVALFMFFFALSGRLNLLIKDRRTLFLFLFFIFSSLLTTTINAGLPNILAMGKFWLIVTFSYLITCLIPRKKAIRYFLFSMVFFASISLIVYVLVNGLQIDLPLPQYRNVKDMPYLSGYLFFVYDNHLTYRNMGPFWEPGIFGSYLAVALLLLVSTKGRYKNVFFAILSLCMISTMSTASSLFLLLAIGYWLTVGYSSVMLRFLIMLIGIIFMILIVFYLPQIIVSLADALPSLFSKFTAEDSASISERVASPITNIKLFFMNPYFGLGLAQQLENYKIYTDAAQTSTSTLFLSSFGGMGVIYTLSWLYGVIKQNGISLMSRFIILIFVFSILNKEPHYYFTLTYIILFYLVKRETPKFKINISSTVTLYSYPSPVYKKPCDDLS